MEVRDSEMVSFDATLIEFGAGAQIQNGADSEAAKLVEFVGIHPMERVCSVQGAPTHGLSGTTLVAAEITEVKGSAEVDLTVGMIGGRVVDGFGHAVKARGEDGVHRKPLLVVEVTATDHLAVTREHVVFTVMPR
jgi:hypothetical protein